MKNIERQAWYWMCSVFVWMIDYTLQIAQSAPVINERYAASLKSSLTEWQGFRESADIDRRYSL